MKVHLVGYYSNLSQCMVHIMSNLFPNSTHSNGVLRPPAVHNMTKDTRTWAVSNMNIPPPTTTFTNSICSPVITPPFNTHCSRKVLRLLFNYIRLYLFNSHSVAMCKEHNFKLQNFNSCIHYVVYQWSHLNHTHT